MIRSDALIAEAAADRGRRDWKPGSYRDFGPRTVAVQDGEVSLKQAAATRERSRGGKLSGSRLFERSDAPPCTWSVRVPDVWKATTVNKRVMSEPVAVAMSVTAG